MRSLPISRQTSRLPQGDVCVHGIALGEVCEQCSKGAIESQPSWRTVRRLQAESKFIRKNPDSPVGEIEINGEKFTVAHIESRESPELSEVQSLFERTFGKEEVDSEQVLRNAVEGKSCFGTEEGVTYQVFVVKDAEGMVFSQVSVKVTEGKKCSLKAVLKGESIDPERPELGNDVKAVTLLIILMGALLLAGNYFIFSEPVIASTGPPTTQN